jgi:arylsulfatase A-like enzyme
MTDQPNIVLVVLDTMRKDVLGAYSGKARTPVFDMVAKDSTVYHNAIAPAPHTVPSHACLFTGKYSSEHGVHETYERKGPELLMAMNEVAFETLPETLKRRGYNTIGISANPLLFPGSGYDRGFNFFSTVEERGISTSDREAINQASRYGKGPKEIVWYLLMHGKINELVKLYSLYRNIKRNEKAINYPSVKGGDRIVHTLLHSKLEQPFFLFLNFMEMHEPYTDYEQRLSTNLANELPSQHGVAMNDLLGIKKIPDKILSEIRRKYYSSASTLDTFFGQMIDYLKKNKLYDNSIIIITSDHGQALKERNYYGHGIFLYNEIVEIPLIVKYPNSRILTQMESGYQSLTSIPYMIDNILENASNSDLLSKEAAFSESFGIPHRRLAPDVRRRFDISSKAIYKNSFKLVVSWPDLEVQEFEYKGKPVDPVEHRSVADSLISNLLEVFDVNHGKSTDGSSSISFEPEEELEMIERLRKLGYV